MNQLFPSSLALTLADGTRWHIRAGDPEAGRVVSALGATMQLRPRSGTTKAAPPPLGPVCGTPGGTASLLAQGGTASLLAQGGLRELLVTVGEGKTPPANLSGPGLARTLPTSWEPRRMVSRIPESFEALGRK